MAIRGLTKGVAGDGTHGRRYRSAAMPMEFLHGRPLSPQELELIRVQIEEMDDITAVDPDVRGIVEQNWPHLLSKLPPED